MKHQIARAVTAIVLGAAASLAAASECEQNFNVNGSFGSGHPLRHRARVPDVTYLPALYRVRDKIQEQGLVVLAVQAFKHRYYAVDSKIRRPGCFESMV